MRLRRKTGFFLLALGGLAANAEAAVFCVSTETELTAAFAAAQANTQSDEIRLRAGRYDATVPEPDGWRIDLGDGTTGIALVGGYLDAQCTDASRDASLTVLDGKGMTRPVTVDTSTNGGAPRDTSIVVRALTFENGKGGAAGGLKLSDGGPIYGGTILVEGNVFRGNVATDPPRAFDGVAGALYAATDGPTPFQGGVGIVVRDNLFVGNGGANPGAMFLFSNNEIAINNNTFSGNRATDDAAAERLIVDTFSLTNVEYANNVFFDNAPIDPKSFDLRARTLAGSGLHDTKLFDNILQQVAGTATVSDGNFKDDPRFVDAAAGNYALSAASLAIDRGTEAPLGGIGEFDAKGAARVSGATVDLGAFERGGAAPVEIFSDGFE